jgi:hypothetical protein
MHRCQHSFNKIPSNLWVVRVGSNSFQGISFAAKPQVVSRYILKFMKQTLTFKGTFTEVILKSDAILRGMFLLKMFWIEISTLGMFVFLMITIDSNKKFWWQAKQTQFWQDLLVKIKWKSTYYTRIVLSCIDF